MSETRDVLTAIETLRERNEPLALATIVAVQGSTYRQPGARLVIPEHGSLVGNLSGGCLEGEVARIGRQVMADGTPRLAAFDLSADGDEVWGSGLGCNGAFEVFIEPADGAVETAAAMRAALEEGVACCLVTVISSQAPGVRPGDRLLLRSDGRSAGGIGARGADASADFARRGLSAGAGGIETLSVDGGEIRLFAEVHLPPPRLLVCGAGHDAIPLVRHAAALGWRATVADVRRTLLTHDRFPEATSFLEVDPVDVAAAFAPDRRAFAMVMTHNYLRDGEYLRSLIGCPLAYLGVMGPRRRTEQLLAELERDGVHVPDALGEHLHAPAGLDIGAEGPDEVAWSIVAEMLAVLRGRSGGALRDRAAPIHGS